MRCLVLVLAAFWLHSTWANEDLEEIARIQNADLYVRLNVPPTASTDDIKKAYRKLAPRYHPDTAQDPTHKDGALFKKINEAQDVLLSDQRSRYDSLRRQNTGDRAGDPKQTSNVTRSRYANDTEGPSFSEQRMQAEKELAQLLKMKKEHPEMATYIDGVIREFLEPTLKGPGIYFHEPIPFLWPSDKDMVKVMIEKGPTSLMKHVVWSVMMIPGWEKHPEIIEAFFQKNDPETLAILSRFFVYGHWVNAQGAYFMHRLIDLGFGGDVYSSLRVAGHIDNGPSWTKQPEGADLMIRVLKEVTPESDPWLHDKMKIVFAMHDDPWTEVLARQKEAKNLPYTSLEGFQKVFRDRKFIRTSPSSERPCKIFELPAPKKAKKKPPKR